MFKKQVLSQAGRVLLVLCLMVLIIAGYGCRKKKRAGLEGSSNDGNGYVVNAPSGLTANTISPYQINLSWNDNSNNEDGFEIQRRTIATGYTQIATVGQNILSYSDTGLIPSTTYYYRIQAFNITPGDRSDWCTEARTTTLSIFQQGLWSQVAAGRLHTLALRTDGTIWSWGWNFYGQLGLGDTTYTNRTMPSLIEVDIYWGIFNNLSTIAAGGGHSTARKTNGTLWTWGSNGGGQLGLGDYLSSDWPAPVGADSDWVAVSAGSAYTIGLKSDGSLWSWGYNDQGQLGLEDTISRTTPTRMGSETNWSIIALGGEHTIALKNNRTLWAWGCNAAGQLGLADTISRTTPTLVTTETDWSIIATGFYHSLAIKTTGTLWSWGLNESGQLGLEDSGAETNRITPTQVGIDTDWIAVKAATDTLILSGGMHTLGLKSNGTLWAWGENLRGQLGLGDTIYRNSPTLVTTETDWIAFAAGTCHSIGLKSNKTIWAWGFNQYGELGLGDTINRNIPCLLGIPLAPSSLIATVISSSRIDLSWTDNSIGEDGFEIERKTAAAGTYLSIATVGANFTSYSDIFSIAFGTYYYYRVRAYNNIGNSLYSNEACAALSGNWLSLTAGGSHTIGLKTNKKLWAWGYNNYGQLGLGDTILRTTPTLMTTESDWLAVAAGNNHTIGLRSDKTIWAWGTNSNGELGLNDTISKTTPVQIDMNSDWSAIDAGTNYTVGLKTNKKLWVWGLNTDGQLGLGDIISRTTPTLMTTESDWLAVAAGMGHTLGLETNKKLWAWGRNSYGQLGLGDIISRTTPTLVTTETDWSIITAGSNHNLAIKTTGTLWVWGRNNFSQLGLGEDTTDRSTPTLITTETDWSVIAAGSHGLQKANYSLALKINGTLWAWGRNSEGELGLGDTESRDTPTQVTTDSDWSVIIDAGFGHSLAIRTNGTLWTWGYNNSGQLGLGDLINRSIPTMVGE